MVDRKVTSWREKKVLLKILEKSYDLFKSLEEKLIAGGVLSAKELEIYESNCGCDAEKIGWLKNEIKSVLDKGQISNTEKLEAIKNVDMNIKSLKDELEVATKENKLQKVEKLNEKLNALSLRKQNLEKIAPIERNLVHKDAILKCYAKLLPLLTLEEKTRSLSLTLADLKLLEEKPELELQIQQLQNASKGWFEDDEEFQSMCENLEKEARKKYKAKLETGKAKSGGNKHTSTKNTGWVTTSKSTNKSSINSNSNKPKLTGFAAAFGGSDSDDD
jgi:hypothetical protein